MKTLAGGSVANTIRGLSSGFGISSGIIGACGDDEQGQLFVNNMSSNGVDLSRLRKKKGHTAQVASLTPLLYFFYVMSLLDKQERIKSVCFHQLIQTIFQVLSSNVSIQTNYTLVCIDLFFSLCN